MPVDPAHLAVLEQALAESPDNVTLRAHVAGLHLELASSDPTHAAAALAHAQRVIAAEPDHVDALTTAARAAVLTGDRDLAVRYERIARALGSTSATDARHQRDDQDQDERDERAVGPSEPWSRHPGLDHPSLGIVTPNAESDADADESDVDESGESGESGESSGSASRRGVPGIAWSPDGSHDDIDGEDPLWISIAADGDDVDLITELDIPAVRLDDVGGLDDVKRRLRTSFLSPLENPELRALYKKSLRGGMLLYGPPGCGKTFLARAIAGELKARFFAVGLHDILDMWLGNSEKNVHQIFETARRHAPCVLFLDEVDALGHKRSNFSSASGGRNVVVQLLNEMDGLRDDNEGVFVIGATNQPWDIDAALRRPGRFDRMVLVLPPDAPARAAILDYHLRERPLAAGIDLARLASKTELYSGADLRLVVETAAEAALEDSLVTGTPRPITADDLERARREVHASTRPWFDVARNVAQFANDGGRYDELLDYLRAHRLG